MDPFPPIIDLSHCKRKRAWQMGLSQHYGQVYRNLLYLSIKVLPFSQHVSPFFPMFCRHIYIPLGGSRHGPLWQFLAAVACFSFTCFWHGALDYILVWTAFNLVIVGGEALAYYVVDKPQVKEFEVHVMFKSSFVRRPCNL